MEKGLFEKIDGLLIAVALSILACGLLAVFSATYTGSGDYFTKQLWFGAAGIVLMLVISFIPPRFISRASYLLYGISMILLILVLLFGKKIAGSKSWFSMGGFGIQPSEFAKITTILALANYLSSTDDGFRDLNKPLEFLKAALFIAFPVLLIMRQPDMGTSLVFVSMLLPIFFWAGLSPFAILCMVSPAIVVVGALLGTTYFIGSLVLVSLILLMFKRKVFIVAIVVLVNVVIGISADSLYNKLQPYQQRRIQAVFDPSLDPLGSGYNVIQSKVAIGSGGLAGKGFLEGTQTQLKFIPEQWTDFIFCMIGEEFGFIGSVILLLLFLLLIGRIVSNGSISKNRFLSVACIGIASVIFCHVVINVGMTIGLLPVIGIPLPLVSYGISSLLSFFLMLGIAMSAYRYRNQY
ncbi:MAG: rod shape-determining protein RodA [Ignavibacteria bacterium]|nr:rod shape-determining protein RodA [Ignavibacteria bacterium]